MIKPRRQRYRAWWMLLLDIAVVSLSLLSAWGIRATFRNFLFDIHRLLFILPYFILIRVAVNLIFEDYGLSFFNFQPPDIARILTHNAIPTALFLALRYFMLYAPVRIPTSIILAEYVLTFAGMVFVRLLVLVGSRRDYRSKERLRRRRVFFYGDLKELPPETAVELFGGNLGVEVVNIFSSDRLAWNLDYWGVRVAGGLEQLTKFVRLNDSVTTLLVAGLRRRDEVLAVVQLCRTYGLSPFLLEGGALTPVHSAAGLLDTLLSGSSIPVDLQALLAGRQFALIGEESALAGHIRRICSEGKLALRECRSLFAAPTDVGSMDVVFDLRYAALWERGLVGQDTRADFFRVLREESERLAELNRSFRVVVPLPAARASCARGLDRIVSKVLIVFTEPFGSGAEHSDGIDEYSWLDGAPGVAAGLFKVAALADEPGGMFYFRSLDAIPLNEFAGSVGLCAAAAGLESPGKTEFQEEALKLGLLAEETQYFQLWRIVKREE